MKTFEFLPIFYLGYIIQPTFEGFEVYSRIDTSRSKSYFFGLIRDAYDFIHILIDRRR